VAVDAAGNVYAAGSLNNSTFVARFDPAADDAAGHNAPAWVAQFGANGGGIAVDHAGAVIVGGVFAGTADFNPDPIKTNSLFSGGRSAQPSTAGFVVKLTGTGAFVWADCFQANMQSGGGVAAVRVDSANNVYAAGNFAGPVDFDPGKGKLNLPTFGGSDVFVAKLTPAGALTWARSMGGSDNDGNYSVGLAVDAHDGVYLTGNSSTPIDGSAVHFGSYSVTGHGNEDVFVAKLDSAGNFQWAADMGGDGRDRGYGVAVDGSGKVYLTGFYGYYPTTGPADFDPTGGTYLLEGSGLFVSRLTQDAW
jgi:hypothetical protein